MLYFRRYLSRRIAQLMDRSGCRPPFLEVGCGTGTALPWLHKKLGQGVGIEVSPEAVAIARDLAAARKLDVEMLSESLFEHNAVHNSILAIDVLEHFPCNVTALVKMHSLLTDRGHLILVGARWAVHGR